MISRDRTHRSVPRKCRVNQPVNRVNLRGALVVLETLEALETLPLPVKANFMRFIAVTAAQRPDEPLAKRARSERIPLGDLRNAMGHNPDVRTIFHANHH